MPVGGTDKTEQHTAIFSSILAIRQYYLHHMRLCHIFYSQLYVPYTFGITLISLVKFGVYTQVYAIALKVNYSSGQKKFQNCTLLLTY